MHTTVPSSPIFYDFVVLFLSRIFQGLGTGVAHLGPDTFEQSLSFPASAWPRPGKSVIVRRRKEVRDITFF